MRVFSLPVIAFVWLRAGAVTHASASTSPQRLPGNPYKLMKLAARENGPGNTPWHIHATWSIGKGSHQAALSGSYDEWWVGPKQYKMAYATPGFSQERFVTPHGIFVIGDTRWPNPVLAYVQSMLESPVPDRQELDNSNFESRSVQESGVHLECAIVESHIREDSREVATGTSFCFATGSPAIRMEAFPDSQTVFNSFVLFRGRYLARSIQLYRTGLPDLDIHTDLVEPLSSSAAAEMAPPANAVPAPHWITHTDLIRGDAPAYPEAALAKKVQGTVVLDLTIRRDGTVGDIQVMSGPPLLRQASIDSARAWRYVPFQRDGKPVSVDNQISFSFFIHDP